MNILEASMLTGLSKDMIRFYEKKGILTPNRNAHNRYREYSVHDIHLLILAKQYNALGIDLNTIAEVIHTKNIGEITSRLRQQLVVLEREAQWADMRYQNARDLFSILDRIDQGFDYDTGVRPPLYYYSPRRAEIMNIYAKLFLNSGIGRSVYRIKHSRFSQDSYPADAGIIITVPYPPDDHTYHIIPSHTYYRVAAEVDKDANISCGEIRHLIHEAQQRGYQIIGDAYIYQLMGHIRHQNKETICVEFEIE